MKAALFTAIGRESIEDALSPHGDVRTVIDASELPAALDGAEALIMSYPGLYTAEFADMLCQRSTSLRWIQLLSAGYDGPAKHGIPAGTILTNAGESWSPTVAEHTVAMLLSLLRRLPDSQRVQNERRWDISLRQSISSIEGKTVTILGYGSIGREIVTRIKPFGARTIGVTRSGQPSDIVPGPDRMAKVADLHDVLRETDTLIVTVPLSEQTRHIVNAAALACLPSSAVLVNVSRGGTVDSVALAAALHQGRLAGAALDVTEPEPLPSADPLWAAPNLVITPHLAGFGSTGTAQRLTRIVAENVRRLIAGEKLLHRVEVPVR
jgi:phosphoglycerate dehydrogenase-like enzyme